MIKKADYIRQIVLIVIVAGTFFSPTAMWESLGLWPDTGRVIGGVVCGFWMVYEMFVAYDRIKEIWGK